MPAVIERVTVYCFLASYALAFALEVLHFLRPRPIVRVLSLAFGAAGLLAQTLFVAVQPLDLASPFGSLVLLAWILAVFYLYGSIHHGRLAWGLFVLPLVLGLIGLAQLAPPSPEPSTNGSLWTSLSPSWGLVHGALLLLAAVGLSVGFVASIMYLVQVRRLRAKLAPGQGVRLLSLERLEEMNRRAILWSFPLLTAGLLAGIVLQLKHGDFLVGWSSPKIIITAGLWVVFAILLYLRYGIRARGQQVALLTVVAFGLLLVALVSVHPFVQGGSP
jgi:ABC-type transport system involved in cytochrome c biogenesis permease subunit